MSFFVATVLTLALAQDNETMTARNIIRDNVNSQTGTVNQQLQRQTGWQTVHGFRWQFLHIDRNGEETVVKTDQVFPTGTKFRIRVEAFTDLYIYVLNLNSDGTLAPLHPLPNEPLQLVKANQSVQVPPAPDNFRFAPPAGKETFYVIASPTPVNWVNPGKLIEKDAAGMKGVFDSFKRDVIRDKSVDAVLTKLARSKKLRSKNIELCPPPTDGGQEVLYASPDAKDDSPFMDSVILQHQ